MIRTQLGSTIDQKMAAVHVTLCTIPPPNVLGIRSTEAKMWGIVPKAAWHCGGDSSVVNDCFGARGITLFHAHWALLMAIV
jgi:hypothetical protein